MSLLWKNIFKITEYSYQRQLPAVSNVQLKPPFIDLIEISAALCFYSSALLQSPVKIAVISFREKMELRTKIADINLKY